MSLLKYILSLAGRTTGRSIGSDAPQSCGWIHREDAIKALARIVSAAYRRRPLARNDSLARNLALIVRHHISPLKYASMCVKDSEDTVYEDVRRWFAKSRAEQFPSTSDAADAFNEGAFAITTDEWIEPTSEIDHYNGRKAL